MAVDVEEERLVDELLDELDEVDGVLAELGAEFMLALLVAVAGLDGPNGLMTKTTMSMAAIITATPMIMPTIRPVFDFLFCG